MTFTIVCAVAFRGFISRIAVFLALDLRHVLSWLLDKTVGQITSVLGGATEVDHALPGGTPPGGRGRRGSASRTGP